MCRGYFFLHASLSHESHESPTQQILPKKRGLLISFSPDTALLLFSAIPHIWWVRLGVRKEEWCWSGDSQSSGERKGEG